MAEQWFYTCEGKQMDPVAAAELKQLAAGGLLKPEDLVWKEGMPRWVPAKTIKGLFPPPGSGSLPGTVSPSKGSAKKTEEAAESAKKTEETAPVRRREKVAEEDERPRQRRESRDDEEDDYDDERPRRRRESRDDYEEDEYDEDEDDRPRRRKKRKQGGGAGIWIGIGVAAAVVLLLVGGGVWFLMSGGTTVPQNGVIADYSVSLNAKTLNSRSFHFRGGVSVEITVTSSTNDDVDVLVKRGNQIVAGDESIGPNSLLVFMPPGEGNYNVEIRNLGIGRTRSHVKIRELQPGQAPAVKPGPPPMGRPF